MWSLAIEEQWYLIWPLAFFGLVRITRSRPRLIAAAIAALTPGSSVLRAVLFTPDCTPSPTSPGTHYTTQTLTLRPPPPVPFRLHPPPISTSRIGY